MNWMKKELVSKRKTTYERNKKKTDIKKQTIVAIKRYEQIAKCLYTTTSTKHTVKYTADDKEAQKKGYTYTHNHDSS